MRRIPKPHDVLTLLRMLRFEQDSQVAELMEQDLRWSIQEMDPRLRARALIALAATYKYKLNPDDEEATVIFAEIDSLVSNQGPREVDVAIITVKEPELDAAKSTFGIPLTQREDRYSHGAYFFESEIAQPSDRSPLRIVVTKAGIAGNDTMAAFLTTVFAAYKPRLCCLVGMAAGLEGQVNIGDVVFANEVVDYKRKIITVVGDQLDPRPLKPSSALIRDFTSLRPERRGWYALLGQTITAATAEYDDIEVPPNFEVTAYRPSFKLRRLLAADELIEDDSIGHRAGKAGPARRTGGAEMEGAGFAAGCEEWETPWLVLRGIADFGRTDGDDRPKNWQFVSTVAAAICLRVWLEQGAFLASKQSPA